MSPPRRLTAIRPFLLVLATAPFALSAVTRADAGESHSLAALPSELPFDAKWRQPAAHPTHPSCPRWGMPTLPPRSAFERPTPMFQAEAIAAALLSRESIAFLAIEGAGAKSSRAEPSAAAQRALAGFRLTVTTDAMSGVARVTEAHAYPNVRLPWGNDFRGFVDSNRAIFGLPTDKRVRVAQVAGLPHEVELRYPNGAVSEGRLGVNDPADRARAPQLSDQPSPEYHLVNPLPADSPSLSSIPALSAEEGMERFIALAPYVSLVPLVSSPTMEEKRPLATKLVVIRARNGESKLVWKVRYRYTCWRWGPAPVDAALAEGEGEAYVDAHSGVVYRARHE
jgi:hypothetical protein